MTVLEYAESRNVTTQGVRQAIKRYSKELDGHISTEGKKFILDETAVGFLDTHIRKPVQVIDDKLTLAFREREVDLNQQLLKANEARFEEIAITRQDMNLRADNIEQKLDKLPELMKAQYDDSKILESIDRLEKTVSMLQAELEEKNRTINELNARLKEMTDKYVEEASKSAWKKMFGK